MIQPGTMTSPTLSAMLETGVASAHPTIPVQGRDKVAILEDVMALHGWRAVLELGRQMQVLRGHPVVAALIAAPTPGAVLTRWMSLEHFGHSRHRTERVGEEIPNDGLHMTLRHVALDGGAIATVNDIFIWGLLVALLEAAGMGPITAAFPSGDKPAVDFYPAGEPTLSGPRRTPTDTVTLRWPPDAGPGTPTEPPANDDAPSVRVRLAARFRADLLTPWTVDRAAHSLALSPRSLQRALTHEGGTFSKTLQRTRVEAADLLLRDPRLSLTDVAFCAGFADHAHFTRSFRRYFDVPPSALREILFPSGSPPPRGPTS